MRPSPLRSADYHLSCASASSTSALALEGTRIVALVADEILAMGSVDVIETSLSRTPGDKPVALFL